VADASRRASAAPASAVEPTRRAGATPAAVGAAPPKATTASGKATQAAASAKPSTPAPAKATPPADAGRAQALLEAKPAAAEGGRYVVQVGAFAEAESARETRQKVEKLGLKTYTQVAQTPSGSRIRVRIGPFGTRAEADAALAKARAAGLKPVVLTL
jgi:DedD protein